MVPFLGVVVAFVLSMRSTHKLRHMRSSGYYPLSHHSNRSSTCLLPLSSEESSEAPEEIAMVEAEAEAVVESTMVEFVDLQINWLEMQSFVYKRSDCEIMAVNRLKNEFWLQPWCQHV